jgi:ABC-2 type transport system ATP-binding protein
MIDVSDLAKSYGAVRALDGVTFQVPQGQVVGLLGPNGAGKTTAMRILTGFVAPSAGTARIDGVDVQDDPIACQRRIGYLPEGNPLYTELRVVEALRFMADMHGLKGDARRAAIGEAIEAAVLTGMEGRTIGTLSKGYRQRVGLAQALLHRPPVLILDEPTTGLDPNQQQEMRDLIRALGRERTVILSTHILPEVEAVCDRVLIIKSGRLVADGTIGEIRAQAASRAANESAALVTVRGSLAAAERALAALAFVRRVESSGEQAAPSGTVSLRVVLEGEAATEHLERVAAACHEHGLPLSRLEPVEVELEDVFALLTAEGGRDEADAPDTTAATQTTDPVGS